MICTCDGHAHVFPLEPVTERCILDGCACTSTEGAVMLDVPDAPAPADASADPVVADPSAAPI